MSSIPASDAFDFWEFVACSKCQLPFMSEPENNDSPFRVPFWLTECGHVICNNHLTTDRSCARCGSQDIQLVPLQHPLDKPMSDWFSPIPFALDAIAYAAKFQQEAMAASIRHYKNKYQHHRALHLQLKRDNDTLKKTIIQLQQRLHHSPQSHEPRSLDSLNCNGKRPLMNTNLPPASSPRSSTSSLGQGRLTVNPIRQPGLLPSSHCTPDVPRKSHNTPSLPGVQRSDPRGFKEKFAFRNKNIQPIGTLSRTHEYKPEMPPPVLQSKLRPGFRPQPIQNSAQSLNTTDSTYSHHHPFSKRPSIQEVPGMFRPLSSANNFVRNHENMARFIPQTSHGPSRPS